VIRACCISYIIRAMLARLCLAACARGAVSTGTPPCGLSLRSTGRGSSQPIMRATSRGRPLRPINNTPTVPPLLTLLLCRNLLVLQLLPDRAMHQPAKVRRRKDEHHVGTAARGIVKRLSRVPRGVPADGRPAGSVRRALSRRARDRDRPAPHAPLPPGPVVPLA